MSGQDKVTITPPAPKGCRVMVRALDGRRFEARADGKGGCWVEGNLWMEPGWRPDSQQIEAARTWEEAAEVTFRAGKIIAIATTCGGDNNMFDRLYALTDAGRVYSIAPDASRPEWKALPELPASLEHNQEEER